MFEHVIFLERSKTAEDMRRVTKPSGKVEKLRKLFGNSALYRLAIASAAATGAMSHSVFTLSR